MLAFVRGASPETRRSLAGDLSASAQYVAARIPVGQGPKGLTLSPDGRRLYAATRTGDNISVIDTAARRVTGAISLGGPATLTPERRGEQLFYSARFAFQGHFGCANCHIEATFDGLQWDLEPDGFGVDIVDNRLLEDVSGTEPFKWNGANPNLETECGPRTEKYFYRSESYDGQQLLDLVAFIKSIPLRPNRFRRPDGEWTAAQERGKTIFERTRTKKGAPIPASNQCSVCHSGPHYTNQKLADVGSGKPTDRSPLIDVPQLTNVVLTAPYLHDGSARTLEEIWTVFSPNDTHGVTTFLQKDELNDLIEYLKSVMKMLATFLVLALAALAAKRICRAFAGRTSPPPMACRMTTSSTCAWMAARLGGHGENGLGLYENGKWRTFRPQDGLAHRAVLAVAVDPKTRDVWVATMGGLSAFPPLLSSNFTQLNSGLANDVVYGVGVLGDFVWTATAAGASRLNTRTGEWALFNERNTPMYEIWTYNLHATPSKVYYAVSRRRSSRVRYRDRAPERLQRSRWRDRDRPA